MAADRAVDDGAESASISVERLYNHLQETDAAEDTAARGDPQHANALLTVVYDELFSGSSFWFEEDMIKQNLDELLVLLVALRSRETNGKELMGDLSRLFDSRLSPGTVYPQLHELDEQDILEMQELVHTKEYQVRDRERGREMLQSAMQQHLALGMLFNLALDEF